MRLGIVFKVDKKLYRWRVRIWKWFLFVTIFYVNGCEIDLNNCCVVNLVSKLKLFFKIDRIFWLCSGQDGRFTFIHIKSVQYSSHFNNYKKCSDTIYTRYSTNFNYNWWCLKFLAFYSSNKSNTFFQCLQKEREILVEKTPVGCFLKILWW